ncbi:hypothetical protein FEV13_00710 (plasmid) [Stutzerimonas degradans]|nr:hypothetical protein FEV13_00710 [Stutzerimonas degradans]
MRSEVATVRAVIEAGMQAAAVSMALDREFTPARAATEVRAIYRSAAQRPLFMTDSVAQLIVESIGAFAESEGLTGARRAGFIRAWLGWPRGGGEPSDFLIGWEAGFYHPAKPQRETFRGIEP